MYEHKIEIIDLITEDLDVNKLEHADSMVMLFLRICYNIFPLKYKKKSL